MNNTDVVESFKENSKSLMESYSSIISPSDYNRTVSVEHLYIGVSDRYIKKVIQNTMPGVTKEVVEIGCGPGRITQDMAEIENINLTAIDVDDVFIEYAKKLVAGKPVTFHSLGVLEYRHQCPVDIFYSQGFHHHIAKGQQTKQYLTSVYNQLREGGFYIIGDEFIPNYANEEERLIRLVIWYAHIINNALKNKYLFLAQEEAKTLLDDIQEGSQKKGVKTPEQIKFTLDSIGEIDQCALSGDLQKARELSQKYIEHLNSLFTDVLNNDFTLDLSRGDYKISDEVFRQEVSEIGFKVVDVRAFGPIQDIGGMVIYVLKK